MKSDKEKKRESTQRLWEKCLMYCSALHTDGYADVHTARYLSCVRICCHGSGVAVQGQGHRFCETLGWSDPKGHQRLQEQKQKQGQERNARTLYLPTSYRPRHRYLVLVIHHIDHHGMVQQN